MTDIFVFGSNRAGRHGRGSALEAVRHHGAVYGNGWGIQGNSYAIPTKDKDLKILGLAAINLYVAYFKLYARRHPENTFNVVAIGCGLAGYTPAEIAPLFVGHTSNVKLPDEFKPYVPYYFGQNGEQLRYE
jgi:hypothetical protein